MISGEKDFLPKKCANFVKIEIATNCLKKHCVYTDRTLKNIFALHFLELLHTKITKKCNKKENLRQHTVCLEQAIYTSTKNVTPKKNLDRQFFYFILFFFTNPFPPNFFFGLIFNFFLPFFF